MVAHGCLALRLFLGANRRADGDADAGPDSHSNCYAGPDPNPDCVADPHSDGCSRPRLSVVKRP